MLTKIQIENFKSFKNLTTIDLKSTNYRILNDTNVASNGILKGAIFVGGNATGKTNIVRSIKVLLDLLFREVDMHLNLYKCLFSNNQNIKMYYEFDIDNNIINYNIEYNVSKSFMSEKLIVNGVILLDRMGNSGKSYITENQIYEDLDNNTLLLRTIYFNTKFSNQPILKKWYKYLSNSVFIDASTRVRAHTMGNNLNILDYLNTNVILLKV